MNIFFLDTDPCIAARLQVRKSATKMVLESAQILSDAVRTYGYTNADVYKGAYHNHPSTIWARKSRRHFDWLCEHALELCLRYTEFYGKIHKSQAVIERCCELNSLIPDAGFNIVSDDLAIKNNEAGQRAFNRFCQSNGSFDSVVVAYLTYYFFGEKSYVADGVRAGELSSEVIADIIQKIS